VGRRPRFMRARPPCHGVEWRGMGGRSGCRSLVQFGRWKIICDLSHCSRRHSSSIQSSASVWTTKRQVNVAGGKLVIRTCYHDRSDISALQHLFHPLLSLHLLHRDYSHRYLYWDTFLPTNLTVGAVAPTCINHQYVSRHKWTENMFTSLNNYGEIKGEMASLSRVLFQYLHIWNPDSIE